LAAAAEAVAVLVLALLVHQTPVAVVAVDGARAVLKAAKVAQV
jgi:hypothetical protein